MAETTTTDTPVTTPVSTTEVISPSASGDWRASLPEDIRSEKSLESFKDVGSLAKSYVETKRLVGAKQGVTVPGADAKPEDVAAYRKAIGVPDTPEGYTIKPHAMMMHSEWNKEAQAGFLKLAHEQGMPPAAVEKVLHWYGDFVAGQVKSNDVMAAEARGELRVAWGPNFDVYMGAANRGLSRVEQAIGAEAGTLVEATKGTDPAAVAKAFHWIESQFTEHGWVQGAPITGIGPEEARTKIQEIDTQLNTLDPNSDRARELVELKYQYMSAARRAA